jgi:hypothetical protein
MEKHFKILGLDTTSTLEEVKKRFTLLSKEYNPEKQTDELKEFFKNEQEKVEESYKVIYLNLIHEKEKEEQTSVEDIVDEVSFLGNSSPNKDDEVIIEDRIKEVKIDKEEDLFVKKIFSDNLKIAAYWARIIGVIMMVLGVIQFIELIKAHEVFNDRYRNDTDASFFLSALYYGLCTLFYFMVAHAANAFATKIFSSLKHKNNNILIEGLQMLSSYFKRTLIFMSIIVVYSSSIIGTLPDDRILTKSIDHNDALEAIVYSTPFTNLIIGYLQSKEND